MFYATKCLLHPIFFTSITRSFRTPCYLCLHVKKRFPKRKIKAWIVQTLLACSKLLAPTYTNKNQFHIDPWFILKSIWYSCISTIYIASFEIIILVSVLIYFHSPVRKVWMKYVYENKKTRDANSFRAKGKLWMYH